MSGNNKFVQNSMFHIGGVPVQVSSGLDVMYNDIYDGMLQRNGQGT